MFVVKNVLAQMHILNDFNFNYQSFYKQFNIEQFVCIAIKNRFNSNDIQESIISKHYKIQNSIQKYGINQIPYETKIKYYVYLFLWLYVFIMDFVLSLSPFMRSVIDIYFFFAWLLILYINQQNQCCLSVYWCCLLQFYDEILLNLCSDDECQRRIRWRICFYAPYNLSRRCLTMNWHWKVSPFDVVNYEVHACVCVLQHSISQSKCVELHL